MGLTNNYRQLLDRITEIGKRCKRTSSEVILVAVTKGVPVGTINHAIELGITTIGESRVQEAEKKFPFLLPVQKHLIGNLQTNKVKKAVQLFDCIQSVDSLKLAAEINKRAREINKCMPIMIEVNISQEQQKHGCTAEETKKLYEQIKPLKNVNVIGLMGIASHSAAEQTQPCFRTLQHLRAQLNLKHCSMGMSNDFEVAIAEGSTMVRIGRALFQT